MRTRAVPGSETAALLKSTHTAVGSIDVLLMTKKLPFPTTSVPLLLKAERKNALESVNANGTIKWEEDELSIPLTKDGLESKSTATESKRT